MATELDNFYLFTTNFPGRNLWDERVGDALESTLEVVSSDHYNMATLTGINPRYFATAVPLVRRYGSTTFERHQD